ncbi:MAG: tetratricopeptide repeat protein [Candidatus Aminicenantes bacterium]|nr:tetratricopeptide repeat protein [Candidatus Aminicenantes bacterium]
MSRKLRPLHFHIILAAAVVITLGGCAGTSATRPAKDENTAAYQYDLAFVAYKYGLEDEAVRYLEKALTLDPVHQPSLLLLASLQIKRKDYARAEETLLKSLSLNPDDVEARSRLARVYRETGAQDKAEEEFLKAHALNPSTTTSLNLAQHFYDRGRPEKALEYADEAAAADGLSVPAWNIRGVILSRLGRNAEAATSFEKVLSLQPENVASAYNLAATYISLERLGEARDILERLLLRVEDKKMKERISEALEAIKN